MIMLYLQTLIILPSEPCANERKPQALTLSQQQKLISWLTRTITTLYLGGLTALIGENEIKDVLYSYGEISSVRVIPAKVRALAVGEGVVVPWMSRSSAGQGQTSACLPHVSRRTLT